MKTNESVNKLIERFDKELKKILLNDLKTTKARNIINGIKGKINNQLSAA